MSPKAQTHPMASSDRSAKSAAAFLIATLCVGFFAIGNVSTFSEQTELNHFSQDVQKAASFVNLDGFTWKMPGK